MRAGTNRNRSSHALEAGPSAACALVALLTLLTGPPSEAAEADWRVDWSVAASGLWQPAVNGRWVFGRDGQQVNAISLETGKSVWRKEIPGLVPGRHVLAADAHHVYALARAGLFVLDASNGKVSHTQPLEGATRLLYRSRSIYVADSEGVKRFDESGKRLLGSTTVSGTLERADGDLVVLHRWIAEAKGPNRLSVVSLKDGAVAYEFKLLPDGDHSIAAFDDGQLVFVDHSRFDRGGKRKLYYTEADTRRAKKLRDVALSSHFVQSENSNIDALRLPNGGVVIASFDPPGTPATFLAYNPAAAQMIWTRSGNFVSGEVAYFHDQLWTTVRGSDSRTQLVAYDAESGDRRVRVALGSDPAIGPPVAAGRRVLLRTRNGLLCLTDAPAAAAQTTAPRVAQPPAAEPPVAAGWQRFRNEQLGYVLELPDTWKLEKKLSKDFGQQRYAIPYALYETRGARRRYIASVHVLVRPAGTQDVEGLWRTVVGYWRNRAMNVKTVRVRRFTVDGKQRIFGVYSFLDKRFNRQQARSLCIVHGGRAYELRARIGPSAPKNTWRQIAQIMRGFRVF